MKRSLLICLAIFSFSCASHAQSGADSLHTNTYYAVMGTYQFIFHPCKIRPVFTRETLIQIEQQRDDKADKTIQLSDCVEVFIPSRKKISSPGFIPLTETREAD